MRSVIVLATLAVGGCNTKAPDACSIGGEGATQCSADGKSIVKCEKGKETIKPCPEGQSCMSHNGDIHCM